MNTLWFIPLCFDFQIGYLIGKKLIKNNASNLLKKKIVF